MLTLATHRPREFSKSQEYFWSFFSFLYYLREIEKDGVYCLKYTRNSLFSLVDLYKRQQSNYARRTAEKSSDPTGKNPVFFLDFFMMCTRMCTDYGFFWNSCVCTLEHISQYISLCGSQINRKPTVVREKREKKKRKSYYNYYEKTRSHTAGLKTESRQPFCYTYAACNIYSLEVYIYSFFNRDGYIDPVARSSCFSFGSFSSSCGFFFSPLKF